MSTTTFSLSGVGGVIASFEDYAMQQGFPTSAGGASTIGEFGTPSAGFTRKIGFRVPDISSGINIPANAVISSAAFTLARANSSTTPKNWQARQLVVLPTASQATWNISATGTPWQVPGATGAADSNSTILATGSTPTAGGTTIVIGGTAITNLVQGWLNGSIPNHGIILEGVNESTVEGTAADIRLSESATTASRPKLEVIWSLPTPPNISTSNVNTTNLSGIANITVNLDTTSTLQATVDFTTVNGTAIASTHYIANSGTLVFAPGESSKTISISLIP